ncbi:hypothetical protein FIBSPDRAFT_864997 [Athelia psychrophila]|uniref:BTB domain-containing protein n=1 Tax=Athelia psychrophila TaxID=1759441 RepID=A0A166FQA6_9AGAM|nr:hypothetical protein FIBSPDRAFT_865384 [Fibularhizoctonia sp. CBS 109695]KZP17330.1 hypothetical protein FIBSPDRAFT_864997 [Fibularhizoctonia sp. CBS 109695]
MSSPTSTAFDTADSPPPLTLSRHYASDVLTVFKVEDKLFRFDRELLDQETNTIPRGVGSKEDPIELDHRIKAADLEILLDFLKLGTRHDRRPLEVFDWTSIIAVCCILGMERIQKLACESLLDPQKALLDQQKRLLDQQNAPVSSAGVGFERDTHNLHFRIRAKGTKRVLNNLNAWKTEGTQVKLRDEKGDKGSLDSMVFFIASSGALHHSGSGLAVDVVDDVLVLRRHRPVSSDSNPWSHPLPEFSLVNSQIRVKFLSDPAMKGCTDNLYPKGSWATKNFVLARNTEKDFHMHPISDFSPWIPPAVAGTFDYKTDAQHDKDIRVLVEESTGDFGDERTSWEIVPAPST